MDTSENSKKTTLYLPPALHARLKIYAKQNKRRFNAQVLWVLEEYVDKMEKLKQEENTQE